MVGARKIVFFSFVIMVNGTMNCLHMSKTLDFLCCVVLLEEKESVLNSC